MKNLEVKLKKYSEIYKLNFHSFKFIKKKNFFGEKITILYGVNEYYFEISKEIDVSNNYFPYFNVSKKSDLENWISSIQCINLQKSRLLKSVADGKKLRDSFKKKFKV